MRKRQYGQGKVIPSSGFNTAQNYHELDLREVAVDSNTIGIISGGTLTPDINPHYVMMNSLVVRDPNGDRMVVSTPTRLYAKPNVDPGLGNEVWVSISIKFRYITSERDFDSDGVPYYKDYQNGYTLVSSTGVVASTGLATKLSIPSDCMNIFDILYDHTKYVSGTISSGDIDTSRQDRRSHYHTNKDQLDLVTEGDHDVRTDNPHVLTKDQVGLSNVTNDAQVKKIAVSSTGNVPAWNGITGDTLTNGYSVETTLIGSSTGLATSLALKNYADSLSGLHDALRYQGTIDCSTNPNYPAADSGFTYRVSSAGLIGGISGVLVEKGDMLICNVNGSPSGDQATVGSNWDIIQTNIENPIIGPILAVPGNIPAFDGITGGLIKDSGYPAQDSSTTQKGLVQLSNSYIGTAEDLATTEKAVFDGLQGTLLRASGDFNTFTEKTITSSGDILLIEDSEDGIDPYSKKKITLGEFPRFNVNTSAGLLIVNEKMVINPGDALGFNSSTGALDLK